MEGPPVGPFQGKQQCLEWGKWAVFLSLGRLKAALLLLQLAHSSPSDVEGGCDCPGPEQLHLGLGFTTSGEPRAGEWQRG